MIVWQNVFDEPLKNNLGSCDNIRKIVICQGDDYTTGCVFDYNYFDRYYILITIDLSKQQELDADLKAIQQIN